MKHSNRPPHLYLDNVIYFITSRTFNRKNFFDNDQKKQLLYNVIRDACKQYGCRIYSWVVLSNHYHILISVKRGEILPKLVKLIHGRSSRRLRKLQISEGRLISLPSGEWKVWFNYWEKAIEEEYDFWTRFNYIHHNPIKHGYVKEMKDYQFSSYNFWLKNKGQEWIDSCFWDYPIIDFTA